MKPVVEKTDAGQAGRTAKEEDGNALPSWVIARRSPGLLISLSMTQWGSMKRCLGVQLFCLGQVEDMGPFTRSKRQYGACIHLSLLATKEVLLAMWTVLVLDLK